MTNKERQPTLVQLKFFNFLVDKIGANYLTSLQQDLINLQQKHRERWNSFHSRVHSVDSPQYETPCLAWVKRWWMRLMYGTTLKNGKPGPWKWETKTLFSIGIQIQKRSQKQLRWYSWIPVIYCKRSCSPRENWCSAWSTNFKSE